MAELELQHYQVNVGYLGFMNQYFICVQLINHIGSSFIDLTKVVLSGLGYKIGCSSFAV